ncbi:hypothetical protein LCGC14_1205590 [marine sediment metagenome]|uniref:Uncharacterized protein n=1 Tax=marine sediment metagenome TaxID=412755 RepID=A0A0F9LJZ5_9ZZZZ
MTTHTVTQADQKFNQLTARLKTAVSEYEEARALYTKVVIRWNAAKVKLDTASTELASGIAEFVDGKKESCK